MAYSVVNCQFSRSVRMGRQAAASGGVAVAGADGRSSDSIRARTRTGHAATASLGTHSEPELRRISPARHRVPSSQGPETKFVMPCVT